MIGRWADRVRRRWIRGLAAVGVVVATLVGCSVLSVPDTTFGPPDRRADVLIPAVLPDVLAGGRVTELDAVFGLGEAYRARGSAGRMWHGSMFVRLIAYRYGDVGAAKKSFGGMRRIRCTPTTGGRVSSRP
ncbi:hypothetical protein B4N89_22855 [Embleya scabrispora]|uniref:Uncharacterized protein n=1 Tax=Embleya scabrispora TaxID=159449 RepID=A0A1T3P392_9ACTN|nr:hypothetical protein [Embleya scabrispora]OPC83402.1 hypothetical protein B4N89_22855 [Embleya scabrispora]